MSRLVGELGVAVELGTGDVDECGVCTLDVQPIGGALLVDERGLADDDQNESQLAPVLIGTALGLTALAMLIVSMT